MPIKVRAGYGPQVRRSFVPGIYLQPNIPEGAFGGQIGQALQGLGQVLEAKKVAASDFQMRKTVIDATTEATLSLPKAMVEAEPGAAGFTEAQLQEAKIRHNQAISKFIDAGGTQEQVNELTLRLGDLESNIAGKAMAFELKAHDDKVTADVQTTKDKLANFAYDNPDEGYAAYQEYLDSIELLQADPILKQQFKDAGQDILNATALGKAQTDPLGTIEKLDGHKPLPTFLDQESRVQTEGVAPSLINIMSAAQKYLPPNYTFQLGDRTHGKGGLGGKRTKEQQAEIVARGASKTMNSKHIGGYALDLTPFREGEPAEDDEGFAVVATAMNAAAKELGIGLTWGGEWETFIDKYYFEIDPEEDKTARYKDVNHYELADQLIREFEDFRTTPYWDVNALRIGFGTDTITNPDGSYRDVREGDVVDEEGAARDLTRRIQEFEGTAMSQVGVETWQALPANVKAPLLSVTYNYGELPDTVVAAVKSGNVMEIASAVEKLSANKKRRAQEASVIRGDAPIGDPIFDSLPLDKRLEIRRAAEARKDEVEKEVIGDFETRLINGEVKNPREEYNALFDSGVFSNAADSKRVLGEIEQIEKSQEDLGLFQAAYRGDIRLSGDTDSKNAMNAGGKALGFLDMVDAKNNELLPMMAGVIAQTGFAPENVLEKLYNDMTGGDPGRALWSAQQLAGLAGNTKTMAALMKGLTADQLKDVNTFVGLQSTLGQEALLEHLRPKTASERPGIEQLDTIATDYFENLSDAKIFTEVDGYWGDGSFERAQTQGVYGQFLRDYKTLFRDYLRRTDGRDTDLAHKLAVTDLQSTWGFDDLSGKFMRYPPTAERFAEFFPKIDGKLDWFVEEVEKDLEPFGYVKGEDRFILQSDEQTHREAMQGAKPTYLATILKANGEVNPVMIAPWLEGRVDIPYPAGLVQQEMIKTNEENIAYRKEQEEKRKAGSGFRPKVQQPKPKAVLPIAKPGEHPFDMQDFSTEQLRMVQELGDPALSQEKKIELRKKLRQEKIGDSNLYDWMLQKFSPTKKPLRSRTLK